MTTALELPTVQQPTWSAVGHEVATLPFIAVHCEENVLVPLAGALLYPLQVMLPACIETQKMFDVPPPPDDEPLEPPDDELLQPPAPIAMLAKPAKMTATRETFIVRPPV